MNEKPKLSYSMNVKMFREYYYLKEELVAFCRENGLPTSGSKIEITDRIANFLDTGKIESVSRERKTTVQISNIYLNMKIESNFVCTEKHRAFFKEHIGSAFSFNVAFQKWLKNNTGKTYKEAIVAYYQILDKKKKGKTTIDKQFEYNIYIRDFFADNQGKSLNDAIKCWKYKKGLKGHNKYEKVDLIALK